MHLEPTDALARERWLAVGDLGGGSTRDRILLAAPLDVRPRCLPPSPTG